MKKLIMETSSRTNNDKEEEIHEETFNMNFKE